MEDKTILTIGGTRPELIKLAPLIKALERRDNAFVSKVCVTGQHRELLDQVLALFDIAPQHDLALMTANQDLGALTARAISGLGEVIAQEKPQLVIVQGDTTTAFCGALAAYYQQIPVAHIEAGLRTGHKYSPFPEELNRRLISQVSDYHFAPTDGARRALLAEGIADDAIHVTGNTVIDALLMTRTAMRQTPPTLPQALLEDLADSPVLLVTAHRRENIDTSLHAICMALVDVLAAHDSVRIVFATHPNPRVAAITKHELGNRDRLHLIEPQPYAQFVWLMDRATVVLTDSGGVQEEAPSLGTPVLVARDTTERPEGVAAGNARVVGTKREAIAAATLDVLNCEELRNAMAVCSNPYGDGHAAQRIVQILGARL